MDLVLPGIDDVAIRPRSRPQDRTNSSPWGAFTAEESKPEPRPYLKSHTTAPNSGFDYDQRADQGVVPDEFALLLRGAGQEVHFDTQADVEMERKAKEDVERLRREEMDPDELLNMLDEMEPRQRGSDVQVESRRSGDSTPTRARVGTAKPEPEIETLGIANSRRRPRTVGTLKPDARPTSAPVDGKTLKAKTISLDSYSRPSVTKVLTSGEIRQIVEEGDEDSERKSDINDRASKQRTAELQSPMPDNSDFNRLLARAVAEERERLKTEHMKQLEGRDANYRDQLEAQKRSFETQIASLEAVVKHQESLGTLSAVISANADTLNALSAKFQNERSFDDQVKGQEIASKQKALAQLEQRLLAQQQTMELDKQHMMSVLKHMQEEDSAKSALLETEREQLRKDREQLHAFQELLRDQDRSRKEETMLERQKVSMLRESLAREHAARLQEVSEQLSDLKLKQSLLDHQRAEMETQDLANRSALQQKFAQLETIRSQISEMEGRAARKVMEAEDRERTAAVEWERVQRSLTAVQADKEQLEEQAHKLHDVSLAVQGKSLEVTQVREDLDKEREEVMRLRQEAQSMVVSVRSDQSRMETRRRELEASARSIEQLRFEVVRNLDPTASSRRESVATPLQEIHQRLQDIAEMKRPKSSAGWRPTFAASEYMKELHKLDQARGEFHAYATAESQLLLKTKLELETKFSDSLAASVSPFRADPSSKSLRDFTSSNLSG